MTDLKIINWEKFVNMLSDVNHNMDAKEIHTLVSVCLEGVYLRK